MAKVKGRRTWAPPAGDDGEYRKTRVRFLPPSSSHPGDDFIYWVPVHSGLPGARFGIVCPDKMHGEQCAACQHAAELSSQGEAGKKAALQFWPSWKAVTNIVVKKMNGSLPLDDDDEPVVKIVTWPVPKTLMEDLQSKIKALPKKERDITNILYGRDIIVSRKGTKATDTKYEIEPAKESSPLDAAIIEMVDLDESVLGDLTNIYDEVSPDKVPALMVAPKALPEAKADRQERRKAAWEDPDEDDDDDDVVEGVVRVIDDEDDDEEEDDTPPPVTTRRKAAAPKEDKTADARNKLQSKLAGRKAAVEEDDEDEDDDEDD